MIKMPADAPSYQKVQPINPAPIDDSSEGLSRSNNYYSNISHQYSYERRNSKYLEQKELRRLSKNSDANSSRRMEHDPNHNYDDNDGEGSPSWSRSSGTPRLFPSYRLYVAVMTSLAMFLGYALLTNFSVAIVKMAYQKPSEVVSATSCLVYSNQTGNGSSDDSSSSLKGGDFNWGPEMQGILLSSYYYGYAAGQVPGGVLAGKFGGKRIMGISMMISGLATLLTHIAAITQVGLLIFVRIFIGLVAGANYPSAMVLMGYWSYESENTLLVALATTGAKISPVVSQIVSGYLADFEFLGGWPLVFYFWGILACTFVPIWFLSVKEKPDDMPLTDDGLEASLTRKELSLSIDFSKEIPWRNIWTSINVWSCCVLMFCTDFMYTLLLTVVPSYLSYVLGMDVHLSGLYSALPHVFCTVFSILCSFFTDLARNCLDWKTINIRKMFVIFGGVTAAFFCFSIRIGPCNATLAILFLSMGSIANSCFITQVCSHVLDICPDKFFVGAVFSWVNMYGIICSFIAPHVSEFLTSGDVYSYTSWQRVFDLCGIVNLVGPVVFTIFASSQMISTRANYHPL